MPFLSGSKRINVPHINNRADILYAAAMNILSDSLWAPAYGTIQLQAEPPASVGTATALLP